MALHPSWKLHLPGLGRVELDTGYSRILRISLTGEGKEEEILTATKRFAELLPAGAAPKIEEEIENLPKKYTYMRHQKSLTEKSK